MKFLRWPLLSILGLMALGCGGGFEDEGSYCLELSPSTHDYGCSGDTLSVELTNVCGTAVTFGEPIIDDACADRVVVNGEGGTLGDGETAIFEVSYQPIGTEPWDCRITFVHDYPTEPEPELPVAGGGDTCS